MKVGILNGPNLNLLGKRNPSIYGNQSFDRFLQHLKKHFPQHHLIYCQSNHEGVLIDQLQEWCGQVDAIVFNPAAYTHTSIAIADAVEAIDTPVVEVHISDTNQREDFRKISYLRPFCVKTIQGEGLDGYKTAISFLENSIQVKNQ